MSRLIKFRAWDTIENCWKIFDIQSMFEAKKVFNYKYRDFSNWQQYTGLKDKNGKEIYEGDIIYDYENNEVLGEIVWHDNSWQIKYLNTNVVGNLYDYINLSLEEDYFEDSDLEICGNIFENHELLN